MEVTVSKLFLWLLPFIPQNWRHSSDAVMRPSRPKNMSKQLPSVQFESLKIDN